MLSITCGFNGGAFPRHRPARATFGFTVIPGFTMKCVSQTYPGLPRPVQACPGRSRPAQVIRPAPERPDLPVQFPARPGPGRLNTRRFSTVRWGRTLVGLGQAGQEAGWTGQFKSLGRESWKRKPTAYGERIRRATRATRRLVGRLAYLRCCRLAVGHSNSPLRRLPYTYQISRPQHRVEPLWR